MTTHRSETRPHGLGTVHGGHITVGMDDTAPGRNALAWATAEAAARGATLTMCHVRTSGVGSPCLAGPVGWELVEPALARAVRTTRQRLGGDRVNLELPHGDVTRLLLDATRTADLMVVGGHPGPDPLRHRLAARVAAWAHCPVVVVRPVPDHDDAPFAGHVVVGVDGTRAAHAALEFALEHAWRHGLPLAVVHVDPASEDDLWYDDDVLETPFGTEPAGLDLLATGLDKVRSHARPVAVKRAVYGGDAVDGLRQASTGAALLVVGRHGDLLPVALRLGSVAAAFVAHADCPVAVVPDAGR